MQHKLSNINEETKTADCLECGSVPVYWKGEDRYLKGGKWVCSTPVKLRNKKWKDKNPHYGYKNNLKRQLLIEQYNQCMICGAAADMGSYLDHCHKTDRYRGVLCHDCNSGLGFFRDKIINLQAAVEYLKLFGE